MVEIMLMSVTTQTIMQFPFLQLSCGTCSKTFFEVKISILFFTDPRTSYIFHCFRHTMKETILEYNDNYTNARTLRAIKYFEHPVISSRTFVAGKTITKSCRNESDTSSAPHANVISIRRKPLKTIRKCIAGSNGPCTTIVPIVKVIS